MTAIRRPPMLVVTFVLVSSIATPPLLPRAATRSRPTRKPPRNRRGVKPRSGRNYRPVPREPTTSPGKLCLWYTRRPKPGPRPCRWATADGGDGFRRRDDRTDSVQRAYRLGGRPHDYAHQGRVKPFLRSAACCKRAARPNARPASSIPTSSPAGPRENVARGARQKEAEDVAGKEFMSEPLRQKGFQPCGDLWLEFPSTPAVSGYRRWLDLERAMATAEYRIGDVAYPAGLCFAPRQADFHRHRRRQAGQARLHGPPHQPAQGRFRTSRRRSHHASRPGRGRRHPIRVRGPGAD